MLGLFIVLVKDEINIVDESEKCVLYLLIVEEKL
jgi:hypothetical protein